MLDDGDQIVANYLDEPDVLAVLILAQDLRNILARVGVILGHDLGVDATGCYIYYTVILGKVPLEVGEQTVAFLFRDRLCYMTREPI